MNENKEMMQNALGYFVPIDKVKPLDLLRDQLVKSTLKTVKDLQLEMAKIKRSVLDDVTTYIDLAAEQYNVKMGGKKGNITLSSYDNLKRVVIAIDSTIEFDERLSIAKALIDECVEDWAKGSNENIITIIRSVFQTNKKGNISVKAILSLLQYSFKDQKWEKAMNILRDAIVVANTKQYIRFYIRKDIDSKFEQISLDISAL